MSKKNKSFYSYIKRTLDIIISFFALLILSPLMLVVAIIIKFDSNGPVIYKQERLGEEGKPFMIYKFRTMIIEAEDDGPVWAEKNDVRCTKVGAVLRKSRIDELPQLWNVLVGDMSIVGPRPEREYFYKEFVKYIPNFYDRLSVPQGLTGLAQVNGGYDLSPEEKIVYDLEYINNQSFLLDLDCILKTIKLVFTQKGAR